MSKVYFFSYNKDADVFEGLRLIFKPISHVISKGDKVAIKVHFGEYGNITYVRPIFIRKIVELVKEAGGKPFVTDTTTLYPKKRFTAKECLGTAASNGFTGETLDAPIVIADGNGYEGVPVSLEYRVDDCELREVRVAKAIAEADALILATHGKGHDLTGFGGAIKNLGMGCVTKDCKAEQHSVCKGILDESRCNGCGTCIEKCAFKALTLKDGKPFRNEAKCMSCNFCLIYCPQDAWHLPNGGKELFQVYLAHAASAVYRMFKGKIGFITFLQDITPLCDCCTPAGRPLVQDIGILSSLDPVAIDKASIDLIDQAQKTAQTNLPNPPDILGKLHGTDGLIQLETAEKLGIGKMKYELVHV